MSPCVVKQEVSREANEPVAPHDDGCATGSATAVAVGASEVDARVEGLLLRRIRSQGDGGEAAAELRLYLRAVEEAVEAGEAAVARELVEALRAMMAE